MLRKRALGAAGFALATALLAVVVSAGRQQPDEIPSSSEVASRVMSPFCPGLSLEECPSGQAAALRARIESRIEAGATNREIDRWLVADYGESVLARPPQAAAWMGPAGFVLAGFALIFVFLARRKVNTPSDGSRETNAAEPGSAVGPRETNAAEPGAAVGPRETNAAEPGADLAGTGPSRARMLEDLSRFAESTE